MQFAPVSARNPQVFVALPRRESTPKSMSMKNVFGKAGGWHEIS
jgi:hypothetical protein